MTTYSVGDKVRVVKVIGNATLFKHLIGTICIINRDIGGFYRLEEDELGISWASDELELVEKYIREKIYHKLPRVTLTKAQQETYLEILNGEL